jgi:DNA mismatch repair protein MutL
MPAPARKIAILDEIVRNQIAAGEVIERPASVVKELVENAIDAGATHIEVDLEGGGADLVRVRDDGCGMVREDVELAFVAHATSKLSTPEDLVHIASLGFRGEALASMGSVARCALYSRTSEAPLGWRIEDEGGRLSSAREAGGPAGTIVEVRDLFYNTPARRRFLKRSATELAHSLDVLQRIALAHEGIGIAVTHDGRRSFDVEPSMDLLARIRRTFGAELADSLVPVGASDGTTRLEGFVAPPRMARADTARQMWFLNGRTLRDRVLARILREGYRGFLPDGRQPVVFLALHLDPARVDVNVHPTKAEVRFRDQQRIFGFLAHAIREAVRTTDMATPGERMLEVMERRMVATPGPEQAWLPSPTRADPREYVREVPGPGMTSPRERESDAGSLTHAPAQTAAAAAAPASGASEGWTGGDDLRGPFLQVARTYIVRAVPDGFEIIDQHALHERLTYELLLRDVRAGTPLVQRLLVPELVELSRAEVEGLSEHLPALRAIGIELEVFGVTTIAVHGLPARLRAPEPQGLVRDLCDLLARTGRAPRVEEVLEEVLHSAACRSSVMAGDELAEEEIRALLGRARELDSDQTCPHARPTRVRFTLSDLEKAFHRR